MNNTEKEKEYLDTISELKEEIRVLKNSLTLGTSESSEKLKFLSNSAFSLIGFEEKQEIYDYIGKSLSQLISDSLIMVNEVDHIKDGLTLKCFYGIEGSIVDKAIKLLGFDPLENTVDIIEEYRSIFMKAKLVEFEYGLPEFAKGVIPSPILKSLQKLLRINKIYTIGIVRWGELFAVIHIFTRKKAIVEDPDLIETFMNQCSIALQRKQLEEELIQAKEKAEESDRLKSAFLANMSHEIRTPLNAVLGFTSLLKEENIPEADRHEYLDYINSGGERLLRLISDMVDISKIEANQLSLNFESINIAELMENLFAQFKISNKENVELRLDNTTCSDNLNIHTDKDRLYQILSNLIDNAQKFTRKGSIVFGCKQAEDFIQFYVKDTGVGIDKGDLSKIFDRFHQSSYMQPKPAEGTGLGLSISKGLVLLLGGDIWVESKKDTGSSFFFKIPVIQTPQNTDFEETEPISNYSHKRKPSVLVAEDEYPNFLYLKKLLQDCNITHASNGKEAVSIFRSSESPDLILMDLKMPEMDGLQAIREIRQFNNTVPIIALSAFAFAKDKEKALEAGCNAYLAKPFSKIQLKRLMDKYLSNE